MDSYEQYERQCRRIREENRTLLDAFEAWLRDRGLSETTVKKHRQNIDFYINEFLLYEEPTRASQGAGGVGMFLGYWFIRKALWASESNIRSSAASLRKFYDFMEQRGDVEPNAVRDMKARIKEQLPEWIATVKRYDDPNTDIEDVWRW